MFLEEIEKEIERETQLMQTMDIIQKIIKRN